LIAGQAALAKGDAKAAVASLTLSLAINPYDPAVRARVPNRGEDGIRRLQFSTSIRPCT
jgi:hypothetical protein